MFKKLDMYIIKKFLGTFFFSILLFVSIAIVIDLSEKIDDFVEHSASIKSIVFDYYINFIPYIGFLLSPLFIFIAVIFFTSRLASRSEIIASYGAGISFYRILFVPYLISALILTGLQLFANHYWVPSSNQKRLEFENEYINNTYRFRERNIHFQVDKDTYAYLESYNTRDSTGYKFALEKFKDRQLVYKIRSDKITWKTDHWEIYNYYKRHLYPSPQSENDSSSGNPLALLKEKIESGVKMDTIINLTPEDFGRKFQLKEAMTTPELKVFMEEERKKGAAGLAFFEVEVHRRTAVPIATIFLTFIGYAIASRKVRGGIGLHLLFGIALSAIYVMFLQFSATFSTKGSLHPFLGVWIPNFVFGIIAVVLVIRAHK